MIGAYVLGTEVGCFMQCAAIGLWQSDFGGLAGVYWQKVNFGHEAMSFASSVCSTTLSPPVNDHHRPILLVELGVHGDLLPGPLHNTPLPHSTAPHLCAS